MDTITGNKNSSRIQLLLLLLAVFVLKGWNSGETEIGLDECFSVYNAQLTVPELTKWLLQGDNPPLWEILLHFWIQLVGIEVTAIRFLSLIFNVATLIPIYLIGERFFGKKVGLVAGILFIASSFSLFIAHEARVYSLLGFLATWSVYFYLKLLTEEKQRYAFIFLTVINGLILYSHYLAYWLIAVQFLVFLSIPTVRKKLSWSYCYHLLVLAVLFMPLIGTVYQRLLASGVKGTWVQQSSGIESFYFILVDFFNKPVVAVLFILVLSGGLVRNLVLKEVKLVNLVLNLLIWIPLIVSFVLSFKVGIFLNRYFYFLLPLIYISCSAVLLSFRFNKSLITKAVLFIPLLGMVFSFEWSTQKMIHSGKHQPIKEVVALIETEQAKNTLIYFTPVWLDKKIVYYLNRELFTTYFKEHSTEIVFKEQLNQQHIYPIYTKDELSNTNKFSNVVFISAKPKRLLAEDGIVNELNNRYTLIKQESVNGMSVYFFEQ